MGPHVQYIQLLIVIHALTTCKAYEQRRALHALPYDSANLRSQRDLRRPKSYVHGREGIFRGGGEDARRCGAATSWGLLLTNIRAQQRASTRFGDPMPRRS